MNRCSIGDYEPNYVDGDKNKPKYVEKEFDRIAQTQLVKPSKTRTWKIKEESLPPKEHRVVAHDHGSKHYGMQDEYVNYVVGKTYSTT